MTDLPKLSWKRWRVPDPNPLQVFSIFLWEDYDSDAIDVTGSGYWVRLRPASEDESVVVRRTPRGGLHRAYCLLGEALPFAALAVRSADDGPDQLLSVLPRLLDPMAILRFAADL
jgi:hypothetical protein